MERLRADARWVVVWSVIAGADDPSDRCQGFDSGGVDWTGLKPLGKVWLQPAWRGFCYQFGAKTDLLLRTPPWTPIVLQILDGAGAVDDPSDRPSGRCWMP